MATTEQPDQTPGKILDHDAGIGEANKDQVEERARELAAIAGLGPNGVNEGHRYQARQELSGREDPAIPNDDSGPVAGLIEEDDVPGESGGATAPATNAASYGDEETIGEALYAEGIEEADHDRMTEARKEDQDNEG